MIPTAGILPRVLGIAGLALLLAGSVAAPEDLSPGWAGPDLAAAEERARKTGQPLLVLVRRPQCVPCDNLERWLTEDPEIARLTRPFIRLRIDIHDPAARSAAARLGARVVPAVILLGPGGMEATRRQRHVKRSWLVEQLQVVAFRHGRARSRPSPSAEDLLASLRRLQEWGDLEGAARLRDHLSAADLPASGAAARAPSPSPPPRPVATRRDIDDLLDQEDDPAALRRAAFELSRWLEERGNARMALHALMGALERIGADPVTRARAGFLAARRRIRLEPTRQELMAARRRVPDSVPQLLALARVAETSGRLYQAYHAAEAAAVYAPGDAWVALELYRLQLLIHLNSRKTGSRAPT